MGIGDWAWGMGHGALGIGHGALGMGHGALGIGHWGAGISKFLLLLCLRSTALTPMARSVLTFDWGLGY